MGVAPPPAGHLEAFADLDGLHGLDAHEGLGQEPVDLAVPVDVGAEAGRHAVGEDLDDAAQRVAGLGRLLDLGDHRLLGGGVEAADLGGVDRLEVGRGGAPVGAEARGRRRSGSRATAPRCRDGRGAPWPASRPPPGRRSPGPTPAPGRRGRRRSRTSACRPGRRGRAGAGAAAWRWRRGPGDISSTHFGHSVLRIRMLTGRAEGAAVAHAGEELDVVALEAHAGAAPVAEPAAGQLVGDLLDRDRQQGGETLDDDDEGLAVGLAGGQIAQHRRQATGATSSDSAGRGFRRRGLTTSGANGSRGRGADGRGRRRGGGRGHRRRAA